MSSLKLHNAMWPGLVGKGDEEGQEPPISLERMLELVIQCRGRGSPGSTGSITSCSCLIRIPMRAMKSSLRIADMIQNLDFKVGSLVAPVWGGTVGDSAMGDERIDR